MMCKSSSVSYYVICRLRRPYAYAYHSLHHVLFSELYGKTRAASTHCIGHYAYIGSQSATLKARFCRHKKPRGHEVVVGPNCGARADRNLMSSAHLWFRDLIAAESCAAGPHGRLITGTGTGPRGDRIWSSKSWGSHADHGALYRALCRSPRCIRSLITRPLSNRDDGLHVKDYWRDERSEK